MSLGVNLLLGLVAQMAQRLGDDYDIEIFEMHHRHKVDAPSGTALGPRQGGGRRAAASISTSRASASRDGITGPRRRGDIGFATLRGGDNRRRAPRDLRDRRRAIGAHAIAPPSRRVFARGAVSAAAWLAGKPPGLYGMKDVLGLN